MDLLDLGNHPLANGLQADPAAPVKRYPLTLSFCRECALVQIRETVDKKILFSRYFWVTGTSAAAREERMIALHALGCLGMTGG